MVYKAKQNWKDLIEKPAHHGLTRRDLLARGMATGFLSLALPEFLLESMFSRARERWPANSAGEPVGPRDASWHALD